MTDSQAIQPLNEQEIDELNQLLFDYSEKVEKAHGKPEADVDCIFGISELDGFFTALLTGPVPVSPTVWMPAIWRGWLPEFATESEAEHLTNLLMRHMDSLADSLFENPETFAPLYEISDDEAEETIVADEWCYGYMRAVALHERDWQPLLDNQPELISAILLFSGLSEDEIPDDATLDELRDNLPDNVFAIRDFWLAESEKPKTPRAGRNDPCPCGSGRKYKQCCLH